MMRFLKLLAVALLTIRLAVAQEPAGIAAPPAIADGSKRPAGMELRPVLVLDPPVGGAGYRFAMASEPRPAGWSLLLGALLSAGFIVRRRLAAS